MLIVSKNKLKTSCLNEYMKVRQNAFARAYEEKIFDDLTEEQESYLKKYINSKSDYKTISILEQDKIMGDLFDKYDIDTNLLIDSFADIELSDKFHVGYFLYWYKKDAYNQYVSSGNDENDNIANILKRIR